MILPPEIVAGIASIFLFLASYFDLKTGEIPEKITRGLVVAIIAIASTSSFLTMNYFLLFESLVTGIGFFAVGYVMFYLGEWGGGDVKLLAGVGCSLGLLNALGYFEPMTGVFPYYINYFINFALAASPYAFIYSLILGLMKPTVFNRFITNITEKRYAALILLSLSPLIISQAMGMYHLGLVYALIPILILLSLYLRAVEDIALQKTVHIKELNERDILAKDLSLDGQIIASRRNIEGITREQLDEIRTLASKGKIPEEITIRWGIKFAPVFFVAFLMTFILGDVLELIVSYLMH